jgi:hypothetical protein
MLQLGNQTTNKVEPPKELETSTPKKKIKRTK